MLRQPGIHDQRISGTSRPLARYGTPGTPELSDALEPLVRNHEAILMANHGVVTYGDGTGPVFLQQGSERAYDHSHGYYSP